jgi:MFS transporter, DHA2 family, multidrug resistance protein
LASISDSTGQLAAQVAGAPAMVGQAVREMFNGLVTSQSLMLATNGLMIAIAVIFFISAFAIALAPKAARTVDAAAIGH